MSYNKNKRRRYFSAEENPQTPEEETIETEVSKVEDISEKEEEKTEEKSIAELSAPKNDALEEEKEDISKEDPVEEAITEAITKIDEAQKKEEKEPRIPTMLNDPKYLDKGKMKVKSRRLRLRKQPSKTGDVAKLLEQDAIITVDNSYKNESWFKVIDDNGEEVGFVMKEFVSPYA